MAAGELTRRWAVALIGVPLVVVVLYAGSWPLGVLVAVFACIGADECYRLVRRKEVRPVGWLGVPVAGAFPVLAVLLPTPGAFGAASLVLLAAATLVTLVWVTFRRGPEADPLAAAAATIFGALYGGLALAVVPLLHAVPYRLGWGGGAPTAWAGVAVVALPLAATWIGDAAAFFAGSAWGKRRLAPSISPKKSWEGAIAGVLGAAAGAMIWWGVVRVWIPDAPLSLSLAAGAGAVIGVGAILGDLAESVLKRDAGVKDSGTLLPGHGGVLDRIDALIFTLPIAFTLLSFLGLIR